MELFDEDHSWYPVHDLDCPRTQFWDAGEMECPCTCRVK